MSTPQRAANRGSRPQVSHSISLARSYTLVWSADGAEIRDMANNGLVIFCGTLTECRAEARRLGLMYR